MLRLHEYKTVIFDCDGVILNSNAVKTKAFRIAVEGNDPGLVDDFIEYHRNAGGVSRYEKFEYFYRDMRGLSEYAPEVEKALEVYASAVREGLMECDEIPGAKDIMRRLKENCVPCYVVSGGDQEEVRSVFEFRGLDKYFTGIYGSPVTKSEHVQNLIEREGAASPMLYFGDAKMDLDVAEQYKMDFVFVAGVSEWCAGRDVCAVRGHSVVEDLSLL